MTSKCQCNDLRWLCGDAWMSGGDLISPAYTLTLNGSITLQVRVLGEAFTPDDEEDSAVAEVTAVWVYQARYRIPLTKVTAGVASIMLTPMTLGRS